MPASVYVHFKFTNARRSDLPLNLPEPRHGHLPRSPLKLVACQVRYVDPRQPLTASLSAEIVRVLNESGHSYPKVEPIQIASLAVSLSPAGLQSSANAPASAYRLMSEDGRGTVTLAPDAVSLETTHYGRWENDFRERFTATLQVVGEFVRPAVTARIGLRYVDLLVDEEVRDPSEWAGRIRDEFLGPLRDASFASEVQLTQQQLTLRVSEDLSAVLRHGVFFDRSTEPAIRYLIDTDVYRDTFSEFNAEEIAGRLEAMHTAAMKLFQYVITPEYYEALGRS